MNGWLLDTNVISELRKPNCNPNVRRWADAARRDSLFISRIALAEIRFGIEHAARDDAFRAALQDWLDSDLRPWFAERILDVDEQVLLVWRRLMHKGRIERHTFPQPDLLIAATAIVHGLGVATRNVVDFEKAGVPVVNPWIFRPPRRSR